jgi:hypothetical protein
MRYLLLLLLSLPMWAMQVQEMSVFSPITGQKFDIMGVPVDQQATTDLADMGADDDGCRHTSGPSEYDYYVAVCPFSFFAALSSEWDPRTGRFREELPPELKDWVLKAFNTDWQLEFNRSYSVFQQTARMQGQQIPARKDFILNQQTIPLEKRFRLALQCYEKRGARSVVLGKIALTGAWALRARMNVPVGNQALDGGYEEVGEQVARDIKPGESFVLAKALAVYKRVFESSSLTDEAYFIAGATYFGLQLRDGDSASAAKTLDLMKERFAKNEKPTGELLRGLVRERKRSLDEYSNFLGIAVSNLLTAVIAEEFPRSRLPANMFAIAECLRRSGRPGTAAQSMDWYLALAKIPESQPRLRADIRAQGKAPGPDAPLAVSLGWLADRQIQRAADAGEVQSTEIAGTDKRLLSAIIYEDFGSSNYVNPAWKPRFGGDQQDCALVLNLIGQAAMDFAFRKGAWPQALNDLWEQDVIKDRNRVNRFHCPVTGEKLLYKPLVGDVSAALPRTVVICTARPIPTNQGLRYGAYLANNQLLWTVEPLQPGVVAP